MISAVSFQVNINKFRGVRERRLGCVGGLWESIIRCGRKANVHLDLVYGGTERVCERVEETVHDEGHQMMVDARLHRGVVDWGNRVNTHGRWGFGGSPAPESACIKGSTNIFPRLF